MESLVLSPLLVVGMATLAGAGALLLWLVVRNPAVGCALLVVGVPITGGLRSGAIIPVLRISEVLTIVVGGGILLSRLLARD